MMTFYPLPKLRFGLLFLLFASQMAFGQTGVLSPNDTIAIYNSASPPKTPATGVLSKWVKTTRVSWSTTSFKCYYYNGVAFRLKFPKSYQAGVSDGKVYPVYLFFHGIGNKGTIYDNEYQLYNGGQVHMNAVDSGKFDGFLIYPQATASSGFFGTNAYDAMYALITKYLIPEYKADPSRILVDGLSGGGTAAWGFSMRYPKMVACLTPISSASADFNSGIPNLKYIPIWLHQGGLDTGPTPATASVVVKAYQAAGAQFTYNLYPTLGHSCWDSSWAETDYFPYINRANKANPWVIGGRKEFCAGETINDTIGMTPGFDSYQWRKDGTVITGATSNYITVSTPGIYDCRYLDGSTWSNWSPRPDTIKYKSATASPSISISGLMSKVIPAPDGNTSVTLTASTGYASYAWQKVDSSAVLSTTSTYKASSAGNYRVIGTDQYGCTSAYSSNFTVVSADGTNKPDPATGLTATALSKTSIELEWSSNPNPTYNETNFEIYQATKSGGPYTLVALAGADSATYTLTGLSSGTHYYYIIRAINSYGAAAVSNEANAISQSDSQAPTAPSKLSIVKTTASSVTLGWTASTDDVAVTAYDVYLNGVKTYISTTDTFTVYNLKHGLAYTFQVTARDYAGNVSQLSNQVSGQALASGLTYKYYPIGSAMTALPNFSLLTPTLTGSLSNFALTATTQAYYYAFLFEGILTVPTTGTYTFRTTSDDGSRLWLGSQGASLTPYAYGTSSLINSDWSHTSASVDSTVTLTAGIYPIAVGYFQNTGGTGLTVSWKVPGSTSFVKIPDSAFVEKAVVSGTAPAIPSGLKATATSYKNVNLSWTDNSDNETGFEIWRSTSRLTGYVSVATVGSNVTSYSDSVSLAAASTYYYRVRAIGKYGESRLSPDDNCSAKWLFNNNYIDSSDNGIVLTATNSPTFDSVDLKEGSRSWVLNGTNQYATIASTNSFLQTAYSAMTISFWMKATTTVGNRIIVDIGGADNGLALRLDGNKLYAGVASNSVRANISVAYTSLDWNHVALVYNGSSLLLYVNGVLAASNTALGFTSIGTTTNGSRIGTNYSTNAFNGGVAFFSGKMDNFSLYNTALAASDIASLVTNTYGFAIATTSALPTIPAAPTGLTASGVSPSKVVLTWTDNAVNETSYQVYRSDVNNSSYKLLATLAANTSSYADTGLYANSVYYYKVRAVNAGGYSSFATEDSALTGNHAPVLASSFASTQYMRYDGTLSIPVSATDADGETLTVVVNNLPAFGSYVSTGNGTGTLNFAPSLSSQQGTYSGITIVVTDQHGGTASSSLQLIVNNNYVPTVSGATNISVSEKQTASLTLVAADQNATDTLTWSFIGLPSFATAVHKGDSVVLSLAPGLADNGSYAVKAVVNDGHNGIDTVSFTITVIDVNPSKTIYMNFGDATYLGASPWNNTAKASAAGDNFANLKDSTGAATSVGIKMVTAWTGSGTTGMNTGNNSGVYPDNVLRSFYYTTTAQTVKIYGLDPATAYNFTMTGSRANPSAGYGVIGAYTIGGVTQQLDAANNSTKVVTFSGIKPASDSTVTLTVNKLTATGNYYGYLNALVIQSVYNDSTAPAKPRSLSAALSGSKVVLNWIDAAYNETGYDVFRATSKSGVYSQLVTAGTNANLTTYTDSTVHGATTYYYAVRAVNSYGATYSDTVSVFTPDVPPVLAAIADVKMKTDSVLDIAVTATDDSTDVITLSASGLPSFASFTDKGNGHGVLHLAPGSVTGNFTGITITATDSYDSSVSKTFNILVTKKNLTYTYVNVNQTLPESSPWNNTSAAPTAGLTVSNLKDADGNNTGMALTFTEAWAGMNTNGMNTGNNSGIYPDTVIQTFYYQTTTATQHVVLSGLSSSKRYNLVFFASRAAYTSSLVTNYTVGNTTVSLDANNNISNTVEIDGITPDSSGKITMSIAKASSSTAGYLGALVIQSYAYNGTPAAPTGLTATGTGKTKIALSWVKASDSVTSYEIWRSSTYSGTYSQVGTVEGGIYNFVDSGLVQGATWFYKVRSLTNTDYSSYSSVAGASTVSFTVNLNLNDGSTDAPAQLSPWNNTNTLIDQGFLLSNMISDAAQGTGMNFGVERAFNGFNTLGATTGSNTGVVPDNVSKGLYYVNYGDSAVLTLTGLNQAYLYNLSFFGSRANPATGVNVTTNYRVSGQTVQLDATNNTSNLATLRSLAPDSTGTIRFSVSPSVKGGFGYLNALMVDGTLKADTAADGSTVVLGGKNGGTGTVTAESLTGTGDSTAETAVTVSAYPNPFTDDVTVRMQLPQAVSKVIVTMVDLNGSVVYRKEFDGLSSGPWTQSLGLSGNLLAKGVYVIQVAGVGKTGKIVFKVIKK